MVLSLAAYVYASVTTESHEFDQTTAFVLFLADVVIAQSIVPDFAGV
ncbi:hypothetical protein [Halolamina sp. C58]